MGMTAAITARWLGALQALLPPGQALSREPDANVTKLLEGMGSALGEAECAFDDWLAQYDPLQADALLIDWERLLGLPDCCDAGVERTLETRRAEVLEKLTVLGGATPQYFIDLAARRGLAITIDELGNHTWRMNAPLVNVEYFRAGVSRVGQRLRTWGDTALECRFLRLKPAHTRVIFAYSDGFVPMDVLYAPISAAPISSTT